MIDDCYGFCYRRVHGAVIRGFLHVGRASGEELGIADLNSQCDDYNAQRKHAVLTFRLHLRLPRVQKGE